MEQSALAAGIGLRGLSRYYMERRELCRENTVVLGYASLRDEEIGSLAAALGRRGKTSGASGQKADQRSERNFRMARRRTQAC